MNTEQMLDEIRETNHGFLLLAQRLIAFDKAQALGALGISESSADLLAMLSPGQVMKLASGNTLLQRFRMDDDVVFGLLTSHRLPGRAGAGAGVGGGLMVGRALAAVS